MSEVNSKPISSAPVECGGININKSGTKAKAEAKWSSEDLIDLIRAVKFSNKDASIRIVHSEITTKMAANESFEYLSTVKLNDVKKVWKKALTGPGKRAGEAEAEAEQGGPSSSSALALAGTPAAAAASDSGGILKFYTVGDGTVQSLAKDYTMKAAAEIAALKAKGQEDEADELNKYVHCFLDLPMDVSGTRPHQALINFQQNQGGVGGGGKKNAGKSKKKGKNKPSAVDDNDNDTAAGADGREIVKIQMAARPVGVEIVKTPMLLYNASRTANTFIHPGEDDKNNYDKIRDLIISDGARGVLNFGGTKAYFYCQITRRKDGQDIVSIDVTSGLAPTQTW